VEAGGTVYTSLYGDAAIPAVQDLLGALLGDRIIPTGSAQIEVLQDSHGLNIRI
jgi:hypothetical protein